MSGSETGSTSQSLAMALSENSVTASVGEKWQWGQVQLTISNSVLPLDKLSPTPSAKDGMSQATEDSLRNLGCNLIQTAGKLLRLPQVAMATGCVLFQRFFYCKSFVNYSMEVVAMGCVCLASKIEEDPRKVRDVINVFRHIKQVRQGKPIKPMILDQEYIKLKEKVTKEEKRVLKELGFCVHVKHPHKLVVMYMQMLGFDTDKRFVQMSWNFMNDSLRTDCFVRYQPETIACACIYLSARKLCIPLPKSPAWYSVLGVEQDDIRDCCYRMICLYQRSKPVQEDLEKIVENLKAALDESRKVAKAVTAGGSTQPSSAVDSPASQPGSPLREKEGREGERDRERSRSRDRDLLRDRSRSRSRGRGQGGNVRNKKHKRDRSFSSSRERDQAKREKVKKKKRERSWSHSPLSKGRRRSRSRERAATGGASNSKGYMSYDRFDKGDSHRDRDRDRGVKDRLGEKHDHRNYQDKYKKGERIERDHYRR